MNTKLPIPTTPLLKEYRAMRQQSQRQRLDAAHELISSADAFAQRVRESIERFGVFDNTAEPFCPHHAPLGDPVAIVGGRSLATALAQGTQTVSGGAGFSFTLVDYEVPPARTTSKAPLMLNQWDDGTRSITTMKIDLLLRHEDGTPMIGEAKVANARGYDTDSVLALVQALAGATQFATPHQQRRLARHYPHAFELQSRLDVVVVAYQPPVLANSTFQAQLDAAARTLAQVLTQSPQFPKELRYIRFLRARGAPSALSLEEIT